MESSQSGLRVIDLAVSGCAKSDGDIARRVSGGDSDNQKGETNLPGLERVLRRSRSQVKGIECRESAPEMNSPAPVQKRRCENRTSIHLVSQG